MIPCGLSDLGNIYTIATGFENCVDFSHFLNFGSNSCYLVSLEVFGSRRLLGNI